MNFKADDGRTPEPCKCGHTHLTVESRQMILEDAARALVPYIADSYHNAMNEEAYFMLAEYVIRLGLQELTNFKHDRLGYETDLMNKLTLMGYDLG